MSFRTEDGLELLAVTAPEMREVDRVATDEFGLGVLQMMENAGRSLAVHALEMLREGGGQVAVLAGSGGNGGGGLSCARHLRNHGVSVAVSPRLAAGGAVPRPRRIRSEPGSG